MTVAGDLLIDRKAIGLNLLKKACGEDLKSDQKLYWIYTNWFGHQIVPMSPKNSSAGVILKKSGGFMVQLDKGSMGAIDYINTHHCPRFLSLLMFPMVETILGMLVQDMNFLNGDLLMPRGISILLLTKFIQQSLIIGKTRVILFSDLKLPLFTPSLVIPETMCPRRLIRIMILASLMRNLKL